MKLTAAALAAITVLSLSACGGGSSSSDTVAPVSASSPQSELESSLTRTAEGYFEALIKGNVVGMSSYYLPGQCEEEVGAMMFGAGMLAEMFTGVTGIEVTKVRIDATMGFIEDGELEGNVSDATQRLFDQDSGTQDEDPFQLVDGKWWMTCTPEPTQSPAPSA